MMFSHVMKKIVASQNRERRFFKGVRIINFVGNLVKWTMFEKPSLSKRG